LKFRVAPAANQLCRVGHFGTANADQVGFNPVIRLIYLANLGPFPEISKKIPLPA